MVRERSPEGVVIRRFAERLAGAILTFHSDEPIECQRAALMLEQPDGTEKNMGGRCKESIADVIESALTEW